jgi:hypothetical protein
VDFFEHSLSPVAVHFYFSVHKIRTFSALLLKKIRKILALLWMEHSEFGHGPNFDDSESIIYFFKDKKKKKLAPL